MSRIPDVFVDNSNPRNEAPVKTVVNFAPHTLPYSGAEDMAFETERRIPNFYGVPYSPSVALRPLELGSERAFRRELMTGTGSAILAYENSLAKKGEGAA